MGPSSATSLRGRGIVVTRPAAQAPALARLIREAGGEPIVFPVIEIQPVTDSPALHALIDRLDEFHLAIFISPNAAIQGMRLINERRTLPAQLKIAGVGGGTARALGALGVTGVLAPAGGYGSEALLALPELQSVAGQHVVIFRGVGGRELLGDTLSDRGARIEYAECYRRVRPHEDAAPLLARWRNGGVHAITVTSSEGLRHFAQMLGEDAATLLAGTPVFLPHPRIAETARSLGVTHVVQTAAGDEAMVAALVAYFAGR
ncbi:MAG TPA: uroporphyrinogen-III synthase [Burkholderiales bacterium]|nr:uroporphyrinogen-III synthase [Burkholderiales bacterium]